MKSEAALSITGLTKTFARVQALRGVDLNIRRGEFFGLLGSNGAGKSTLIHCITGLCRPTGGSIHVFGYDTRTEYLRARQYIGLSPQEINLDRFFPIKVILQYQAGYFGFSRKWARQRAEQLLDQFQLREKENEQFHKLSGGMKKRLLIAKALMNDPKVLILDEPTAGLDVELRHDLWTFLRDLKQRGITILLTTHYIDEAELLCERIGILDHGKLIALDTPANLVRRHDQSVEFQLSKGGNGTLETITKLGYPFTLEGVRLTVWGDEPSVIISRVASHICNGSDERIEHIHIHTSTLEDVFMKMTGRRISNPND